jgi:drug/metabolite transporter (DMT)-like permease
MTNAAGHPHPPFYHLKWGIFYILIAWFFFTCMATVSRFASQTVPLPAIVFFQNFVGWVLIIPWMFKQGWKSLHTQRFGLIFLRSVGGLLAFTCLFMAVRKTTLVDAVLLNNAAPLLIPFVMWIWLKVPINHKLWLGIILGFLGILFILKPGKEILDPGALFGLGAAICSSFVMVSVRILSYTERHHTILFYYFLIASLLCLPFTLYYWKPVIEIEWIELACIGLLSYLGQWAFMRAFHHALPSQLGPFCYMAVVYSGLIEWALWGKVPDLWAWCGIFLVCAGGIWTIQFSKMPPPPPRETASNAEDL